MCVHFFNIDLSYDNIYEYELDDYYLRYDLEMNKYIITDKETGKSREVFNAPNKDSAFVTDIYIDKNLIYYGNEYGFFSMMSARI